MNLENNYNIITDIELLKRSCEKVLPDEIKDLKGILLRKLEEFPNGVGLAAPQLGILKQIAVIRAQHQPLWLINPRLEPLSSVRITTKEGCLSFPGVTLTCRRYAKIKVWSDDWANCRKFTTATPDELKQLEVIILQHEYDHIFSTLFFDRIV